MKSTSRFLLSASSLITRKYLAELFSMHITYYSSLPVEKFKKCILELIHELKITRWHYVPITDASMMKVSRISGALTNAVCIL